MTAVANDKLAAAVQRLTHVRRWFEALSAKSRTPAEARARIEDAQAIADVLAHVREQPVEAALAVTAAADLPARIEAALSGEGRPRGNHMVEAYASMAARLAVSDNEHDHPVAEIYDLASRCIANETAMFDGLAKLMPEVIAALGNRSGDSEWVLVPRIPTDAMLQGACKSHTPGQSMGVGPYGSDQGECPSFERRRRIWADMVGARERHEEGPK